MREEKKSTKMINLNTSLRKALELYLQFTKPIHQLNAKEIKIVSSFLVMYYDEYYNFKRTDDIWKKCFEYDSKIKIMDELEVNTQIFNNHLTSLRKKKVIINNQISPSYIPLTDPTSTSLELRFIFNIKENAK